jgi:glucokinase
MTAYFKRAEQVTAKTVAAAAADGDKLAGEIWDETIAYLSLGLGNIIVALEPEAIILGGGVATTGEQLLGPLRERLRRQIKILPVENLKILPAGLGAESGIYGAIALALTRQSNLTKTVNP